MEQDAWLAALRHYRAIAVIRAESLAQGVQMAQAVAAAGMHLIEVTWTSDRPEALVQQLRLNLPHCWIGAGTLLNQVEMQQAIAAGAQFLFSPHTDATLIRYANRHQVPVIPGAFSPSEIVMAWQAGASTVKVFPVQSLGGAGYIRNLQGPLGHIPLIPTGGITLNNAAEFIQAGAIAVGLSGQLFPQEAIAAGNWDWVTSQAQMLVKKLGPGMKGDREGSRCASAGDLAEFPSPYPHQSAGTSVL